MNWNAAMPLLVIASSLLPGLFIFGLRQGQRRLRTTLNLFGAVVKIVLIAYMLWGVERGEEYTFRWQILPNIELLLNADALAMLFITLSAVLWLLTTLYAIGYLEHAGNRSRFFGFFSLCVTSTMGIAMAGNLFTFFFFYELLTLTTYPLVVHRGSAQALRGGSIYLAYTLTGGTVFLAGVVTLYGMTGRVDFVSGGTVGFLGAIYPNELRIVFLLLIMGVGVKAAIVPLQGWLPHAMVAPAPVSALLHAVAVVKAGAFGVMRIVYEVYGLDFARTLDVLTPLAIAACVTIVWGSLRAIFQDDLKRRLAYSTVSQVSYIVLGIALYGSTGTIGGLVHLVHQGIMKITLFFCAGNYAETLGIHKVSEMNGVGRRMPLTTLAFSLGALGMIGAPLTAGYVSKHYLSQGAHEAGAEWAAWVLTLSSVLNAIYFLPILYRAWIRRPPAQWEHETIPRRGWKETHLLLLLPPLVSGAGTVLAALLADSQLSPLSWAKLIAVRQYLDY